MKNIDIKYKEHFKLYIPLRDKIIFDSELINHNIPFYIDDTIVGVNIRYFLEDKYREAIDKIICDNEIIASTETIVISDYHEGKKVQKLYLIISLIVIAIMLFVILFDKFLI